jgi:cytoskeletal protein RodZ
MKILIMTAVTAVALPFMALGQTEPQQTDTQTKDTQTTAPAKGKKMRPAQEQESTQPQAKPETQTNVRGQTKIKGRAPDVNKTDVNKTETGTRSSTSQTNVTGTNQTTTTVNKQEFRSRHTEVFSLGQHPKEFFVQRFGASHFRLIGNTYFVFVDGCWVSVNVDGFVYTERVICVGDPEFIEVE